MIVRDYVPGFEESEKLRAIEIKESNEVRLGNYFTAPLRLVAEIQDLIVGFAAITTGSGPCSHCGRLRIHVSEAWRGGNVGGALMENALTWAENEGLSRIEATPYICDDIRRKQRFFERYGFVVEGWKRKAAQLPDGTLTDVLMMALVL